MDEHEWLGRIKSARRKKRLVKTHRDKQLIQLNKRYSELWYKRQKLPPVVLEQPYQRGWKRFFVLRDDIKRSPKAAFYEELLKKINTVEYHYDKSFKRKKRRRGRYLYTAKHQHLREFYLYEWLSNKLPFTEQEKACFTRVDIYDVRHQCNQVKYVITEPWRYVLKIAPHMVTHKKQLDIAMEAELAWIDNHIDNHFLRPRIDKLLHGRLSRWRGGYSEPIKYINTIKNIPRYSPKEAYLDLET